ncbi:uncharacterized protein LOC119074664 [Bradysia coprophila]|uniref:uncharacterized protein LOC119074664 n=1 Tax=Bradysia coprophila TaxID=38358 RepID=UPI00187DBD33|nr:uncharacterized protein LOC119074664 [Bradysia coprophila]
MTYVTVIGLFATVAINVCMADVHSWGQLITYQYHRMYERTLIDESSSVPKDYTIFYKYYGAPFKPVAHIEIEVNTKSEGYINIGRFTINTYNKRKEDAQTFDAQVSIKNATNVTATLRIHGMGMMTLPSMGLRKLTSTRSVAYVHAKSSIPSIKQNGFVQSLIGKRRNGDELIHFESRNVRNQNRFPSRAFEYSGSEYITCVGFSFDSPTAMVMINTTFVGENEFNGIVYDMNSEHFVANMSVYGIKILSRPYHFEGVI